MGEKEKTREQLTQELAQSRKRIAELEAAATASGKMSSLYYGIFENFVEAATDSFSMWDSKLNLVYIILPGPRNRMSSARISRS
jgi:hypothetical protein